MALNGRDFRSSLNYTFYAPPTVSAVLPAGGPRLGGTVVTVRGAGLSPDAVPAALALCRFGLRQVNGALLISYCV